MPAWAVGLGAVDKIYLLASLLFSISSQGYKAILGGVMCDLSSAETKRRKDRKKHSETQAYSGPVSPSA